MFTTKNVILVGALLAAGGAGAAFLTVWSCEESRSLPFSRAAWVHTARELSDLSAQADAIVVGRVGATFASRVAYSDNGQDDLPFELVEIHVLKGIKGANAGDSLLIERAGGTHADGTPVNVDADGGSFVTGETAVLFLKRQENGGGYYYILNDQARYEVRSNTLVAIEEDGEVSQQLHGKSVDEAVKAIAASLR